MNEHEHNYRFLLLGLMCVLLLGPLARDILPSIERPALGLGVCALLISGAWTLRVLGSLFRTTLTIAIIGVAFSLFELGRGAQWLGFGRDLALLAFCLVMIVATCKAVLFGGRVDLNKIYGAICIYLLIGIAWSALYSMVDGINPDAFRGLSAERSEGRLSELVYYSFVTLTTLGYGEIVPVSAMARVLAYFEAILGQMYIAILIASLVGLYLADRLAERERQ
jgi:hypothetical protein